MLIIGITGYIGSGKSECIKYIQDNYYSFYISTDDIARYFIKDIKKYDSDTFISKEQAEKVKSEIHPLVWARVKDIIKDFSDFDTFDYILVETALPNDDFFNICDKTICIKNTIDKKIDILKNEREYNENKTRYILTLQKEYETYYDKCDDIIINNETKEDLHRDIDNLLNKYGK